MRLALIKAGVVVGTVDVDGSDESIQPYAVMMDTVEDITNLTPQPTNGWVIDPTSGNLVSPSGTPTNPSIKITRLAMRQRFSPTVMMTLETAALTVPFVRYLMNNLIVATFVDLARPDTIAGVDALVSLGYISSAQATAILTTPPADDEMYVP
jgi:hypothetical protein